jgi:hypothetical protein
MAEEERAPEVQPEAVAEEVVAEPEVVLPSDEATFEMPDKFAGKSAEEIAKSYMELEAHKQEVPEEVTPNEELTEVDADSDTQDLITEYTERGTDLTEEDYKTLEEKGYSRKQVDIYKAGVEAQRQQESLATIEQAGTTAEEANSAIEWARENWSEDRIAQFNSAIETSPQAVQVQMIQMLTEGYRAGNTPKADGPIHSQSAPVAPSQGYESMNQLVADMNDPRYDSRTFRYDPAYYRAVRAKAAKSSF